MMFGLGTKFGVPVIYFAFIESLIVYESIFKVTRLLNDRIDPEEKARALYLQLPVLIILSVLFILGVLEGS
jgi:hypothetical protein